MCSFPKKCWTLKKNIVIFVGGVLSSCNPFVLCFGCWTLKNKVFYKQNKGHFGSRFKQLLQQVVFHDSYRLPKADAQIVTWRDGSQAHKLDFCCTHFWTYIFWLVVSTHLKHISQNGESSPNRGEHKKCLKPPSSFCHFAKKRYATLWIYLPLFGSKVGVVPLWDTKKTMTLPKLGCLQV